MGYPVAKAPTGALQVGFDPSALDAVIQKYRTQAAENLALCESLGPRVKDAIDKLKDVAVQPGEEMLHANSITILYDRLTKAGLNLTKAVDELARLRSFASGGPDSRPDLASLSEIELRAALVVGIRALGITSLDQLLA